MGRVIYVEPDGVTDKQVIDYDDEFSFKNYANRMVGKNVSNKVIYASYFAHEAPGANPWLPGTRNVTFVKCNLDNCVLPQNSTLIGCFNRRVKVQNDLRDWIVNDSDQPTKVLSECHWLRQGYSVDPADIPAQRLNSTDEIKRVPPEDGADRK